jgi:hypothetical protein
VKDFFKPDDFAKVNGTDIHIDHCNYVNRKLNALIESWPIAYSTTPKKESSSWYFHDNNKFEAFQTHKARIAFIEEIKREPCKHIPIHILKKMHQSEVLTAGKVGFDFFDGWECRICGVELEANWDEKK